VIVQPRGATTAKVGGVAPGTIGGRKMKHERRAAEQDGLRLTSPMATAARAAVVGVHGDAPVTADPEPLVGIAYPSSSLCVAAEPTAM
jgi:hypothetical protein